MKKPRKYLVIARVSLANAITYRANTFSRFAFYTLFIYVFMSLWRAIYKEGGAEGYTYVQMVWYLVMTEFVAFAGGTPVLSAMNDDVKSGAIAYQIGRPVHYLLYHFASSLGNMLFNAVAFGALAAFLGLAFVGPLPAFTPAALPFLFVSVTLGVTLNFFFLSLIGLTAFVVEDNLPFYLIWQKLNFMLGMFLPVEFLPDKIQAAAKNLPFSYVYWAPAKIFVNFSFETALWLIPRQAAWTAAVAAAAFICYGAGARRLQINGG